MARLIVLITVFIIASQMAFAGAPNAVGQVLKFDSIIQSDERIKFSKGIEESVSPNNGSLYVKVPILDLPGKGKLGLEINHIYNSSAVGTFSDEDVSGGNLAQIGWMHNLNTRSEFGGMFYAKYGVIDGMGFVSEGMISDTAYAVVDFIAKLINPVIGEIIGKVMKIILSYIHIETIDNSSIHVFTPQLQPVITAVKGAREPRGLIGNMTDLVKITLNNSNYNPQLTLDAKKYISDMVNYAQSGNINGLIVSAIGLEKHPLKNVSVVMNDGSSISMEKDNSYPSPDHTVTDKNGKKITLYNSKQPDDEGKYILIYDWEKSEYVFMRGDGVKYHIKEMMNPVIYVGGGEINVADIYDGVRNNALNVLLAKLPSMVQIKGIPYGVVTSSEDEDGNKVTYNYESDWETIEPTFSVRRLTGVTDSLGRAVQFNYYNDNEGSKKWEMFKLKEIVYPDGRKTSYSYTGDQNKEQPSLVTITDPLGRNTVIQYKSAIQNQLIGDSPFTADVVGAFYYINKISYPIGGYVEYESSPVEPDRSKKRLYHDINLTSEFVTKRTECKSDNSQEKNSTTFEYQFEQNPTAITTGGLYLNLSLDGIIALATRGDPTGLLQGGVYIQNVIEVKSGKTIVSNMNGKVEEYQFQKSQLGNFNHWMFSISAAVSGNAGDNNNLSLVYGVADEKVGYMPARLLQTTATISGSKIAARTETYGYDDRWNITSKRVIEGYNDYTFQYQYDSIGNLIHETGPLNYEVIRQFTPQKYPVTPNPGFGMFLIPNVYINYQDKNFIQFYPHLLFSESVKNKGSFQTKTYEYDGFDDGKFEGKLHKEKLPENVTKEYTYTSDGNIASVKDGNGNLTSYSYDYNYNNNTIKLEQSINVTSRSLDQSTGSISQTVQTVMSTSIFNRSNHFLLSQTDPMGYRTSFKYDILGRVTNVVLPDQSTLVYKYDDTSSDMKVDVQDSEQQLNGSKIRYRYDGLGRLWSLEKYLPSAPLGDQGSGNAPLYAAATNFYKPWGELDSAADFLGRKTTLIYDELGRLLEIQYPDNSKVKASYSYNEINNNHKITLVNEMGKTTGYLFDSRDKLINVNDANAQDTYYHYDDLGNLTNFIDANGNGVQYAYDQLSRLTKETYQDNSIWTYNYDNNGNLIGKKDAKSFFNNYGYTYDEMDRLVQSTYGSESDNYGYDLNGKSLFWMCLDSARQPGSKYNSTTYTYNNRGWLTNERQSIDASTSLGNRTLTNNILYYYNSTGQLTNEVYPSGTNVFRTYDGLHRLTTLRLAQGPSVIYNYLKNDLINNIQYGNGVVQAYQYDLRDRVLNFNIAKGPSVLMKQTYIYDASGNRTNFTDEKGYSVGYTYDALDRLSAILYPENTGNAAYFYDNTGNRINYFHPYGHQTYNYNNLNELKHMTVNKNGTVDFDYDANGNLTHEVHKAGNDKVKEVKYTWGMNDKLDQIEFPQIKSDRLGSKFLNFAYTPAGNRIRKIYKDSVKTYTDRLYTYNASGALVEEVDNLSNKIDNIYIGPIRISDGIAEYQHKDVLSSTVLITDPAGKVVQKYRYDPFGGIEFSKGNSDNKFLFNSKESDESGLSYYGARYYNGIIGRWISRDPDSGNIFEPYSLNQYQFCYNNPLIHIDKDGRVVPILLIAAIAEYAVITMSAPDFQQDIYFTSQAFQSGDYLSAGIGLGLAAVPGLSAGLFKKAGDVAETINAVKVNNKIAGTEREVLSKQNLIKKYGEDAVQSEQYLRDVTGKKAKDPLTGKGRRIDNVVIKKGKAIESIETTSLTANKNAQILKENRIRNSGGTYIKDRNTGNLVDFKNTSTKIERLK